ncbi:hypothetical protein WDW86_21115 [Bdellovibrionota bacterium FG-2]
MRTFVTLALFLALPTLGLGAGDCLRLARMALEENRQTLLANDFIVHRGADFYKHAFGRELAGELKLLNERMQHTGYIPHWLDSGAGEANAIYDFVQELGLKKEFRLTAVAYKKPYSVVNIEKLELRRGASFRYLDGKYLEDRPVSDLGPADLITDYFGPFAYSSKPDVVLQKYFDSLHIGGKLFVVIPQNLTVEGLSVMGYFQKIRGAFVEYREASYPHTFALIVSRTSALVEVPPLELVEMVSASPPKRVYKMKR